MRLLCWNMHGGPGSTRDRLRQAWEWIDQQEVDVLLLQETVLPESVADTWGSTAFSTKYSKHWGSAVLTRRGSYGQWSPGPEHPWLQHLGGAACIAQPENDDSPWLVSLHSNASAYTPAELDALPSTSDVRLCNRDGQVFEIDLALHELEGVLAGRSFVAGGDLNSSLLWDGVTGMDENTRLFAHMRETGLIDLRPRHEPREQQTFFRTNGRPHQLDHVFADAATERAVSSWSVLTEVVTEHGLSDHAPILVEVEGA